MDREAFVDELLDRLLDRGLAERRDGWIRLTAAGIKAVNPEGRQLEGNDDLQLRLLRLAIAVGLDARDIER